MNKRKSAALVAVAFLAGCIMPSGPAPYAPRGTWEPDPEQGTYAIAYDALPALPDALDVDTAVEIALVGNPSLETAFMRVEAAKARVAAAKSAYLPTIDAVARYSKDFEVSQQNAFGFALPTGPTYSVALRGSWVLFDGLAREYRIRAARLGVKESRAARADARRLLRQAVESAFYDTLGAEESVRIAEADLGFERDLLDETTKRQRRGDSALSDKLNLETRVESAVARVEAERSRLRTLRHSLAELLGARDGLIPERTRLVPLDDAEAEERGAPDESILIRDALRRRPDLAVTEAAFERAAADAEAANADWYPRLAVSGEAGRNRFGNARFTSNNTATNVGVEATWNLFAGGATAAGRREAVANRQVARAQRAEARNRIIAEIRRSVEAVRNAQRQLEIVERQRGLAERTRDLVRKEYASGNASLVRLNEVQRDFAVAKANVVAERVNLRTAWSALRAAASTPLARQ